MKTSICKICDKTFNLPDEKDESVQRMMKVINALKIEDAKAFPSTWDWYMSEQRCSPQCAKSTDFRKPN